MNNYNNPFGQNYDDVPTDYYAEQFATQREEDFGDWDPFGSGLSILDDDILPEPMPDAQSNKIKFRGKEAKKTKHELMFEHLFNNFTFKIFEGQLYTFTQQGYTPNFDLHRELVFFDVSSTKKTRSEAIETIKTAAEVVPNDMARYIQFKNGVYNVWTRELEPSSPEIFTRNLIPHDYVPLEECYSPDVDKFMNNISVGDEEIQTLLWQFIGYCFIRTTDIPKFFILYGKGANGKSAFNDVLNEALGRNNCTSVKLGKLNDQFSRILIHNKLANICNELPATHVQQLDTLKEMTAGDPIEMQQKHKEAFIARPYAKHIFACNELPSIGDTSEGFKRRCVIVPFNAHFQPSDADHDPDIGARIRKTESDIQYLISRALTFMTPEFFKKQFIKPQACEELFAEFEMDNNPVLQYVDEHDLHKRTLNDSYMNYAAWATNSGNHPASKIKFGKRVIASGQYWKKRENTISAEGKPSTEWVWIDVKVEKEPKPKKKKKKA